MMATSSPTNKTIELQANTTVPRGAAIKLTVEYRSKINKIKRLHSHITIHILRLYGFC